MSDKPGLTLSAAERDRFATYLETESIADEAMARAIHDRPGLEVISWTHRARAMAKAIVARELRGITDD